LWKGATKSTDEGLDNVRFLRIYIDHLEEYFAKEEVDEIWITFPDPYLKQKYESKKLTSTKFLKIYQKVVKPGHSNNLKTDSREIFSFTKETIEQENCRVLDIVEDIYHERADDKLLTTKTNFEKKHLAKGRTISFVKFSLP